MESLFLDNYKNQLIENVKVVRPNISDDELNRIIDESISNNKMIQDNKEIVHCTNDYEAIEEDVSLLELFDYILTEKPIITPFGTLFDQHNKSMNLNAKFIEFLTVERDIAKGKKFKAHNEGNIQRKNFYDKIQLSYKLLNNSYYGITGTPSSFFYDADVSPSVTYSGQLIIQTSIIAFERLLANNIKYNNLNDLLEFIKYCKLNANNNSYTALINNNLLNKIFIKKHIKNNLINFNIDDNILNDIINNLNNNEIYAVYYINNLLDFLNDVDIIKHYIEILLTKELFDPKNFDDETKAIFKEINELVDKFVVYNHNLFNLNEIVDNLKRKVITCCDTDSNFIYIKPFYDFIETHYDTESYAKENKNLEYTICNIIVTILSHYIQGQLNNMTYNCNLQPDYQKLIKMKSEFLFKRMMFTRNKKAYAGIITLQENNIINPSKFNITGLNIKKSTVNQRTREVLSDIVENKILRSESINRSEIVHEVIALEKEISVSLQKGEITFLKPDKVNKFSSYKAPFTLQSVRGSLLWNELYPDNLIVPPTKINTVKLKEKLTFEEISDLVDDKEILDAINRVIFKKLELAKYGLSVIALPKSIEKIPEWIIPLIDIDTIVEDNVNNCTVIFNSLDIRLMKYNNKEYYSTFINF